MNTQLELERPAKPFWESKTLEEMTPEEWDLLCDGCARCCLCKLEAERSGTVYYTNVACRLLDSQTCRCRSYEKRNLYISGCVRLTPRNVREFSWLPPTCAYRRLAIGKDLFRWHHLISGDRELVHKLGISVRNKVVCETKVRPEDVPSHIIDLG